MATPFDPPERFNLYDYFLADRLREGRGERVALRLPGGTMSYAAVAARAELFAAALVAAGLRREERVLIALPDGADFVAALFGVLRQGGVVVMVNPQLGEAELAAMVDYVAPRLAVVDAAQAPTWRTFRSSGQNQHQPPRFLENGLVVVGDASDADAFEAKLAASPGLPPQADTHRDDPALWLFSGGTTGRPKAVVQPHRSFANTTELYALGALGYRDDDVTISVPKLFFGYATGSNLFFPFRAGASAVLFPEPPTPELLAAKIAEHGATILINVPTFVQRMVGAAEAGLDPGAFSTLRFATSAGEALSPALYHRWKATFGVELLDGLGTAEMWHIFVTNRPGDVEPGTLGRPVEGFDVSVRDDEGRPVPAGELGRLWVRGASRAHGYWQSLEKTTEAFRGEYFVASDLVQQDEAGRLRFGGRSDDVFKVGGRWLVPSEVEDVLLRHPAVQECAVIGVADEAGLTKPYAFVLPRPDALPRSPAESAELETVLREHVLACLAAYKHPRRVLVVESLPRTHLGKIDRGKLRRQIP